MGLRASVDHVQLPDPAASQRVTACFLRDLTAAQVFREVGKDLPAADLRLEVTATAIEPDVERCYEAKVSLDLNVFDARTGARLRRLHAEGTEDRSCTCEVNGPPSRALSKAVARLLRDLRGQSNLLQFRVQQARLASPR